MIFGSLFLLVFSLKDIHLALAIHLVVQCTGVAAIPSSRLFPFYPLIRNTESARRKNTPTASRDSRMSGHRYTTHSFVHPSSELLISLILNPADPSAVHAFPRAHPVVAAGMAEAGGRLPGHPVEAVHEQRARQGQPAGGRRPPQRSHTTTPTHGRGKSRVSLELSIHYRSFSSCTVP